MKTEGQGREAKRSRLGNSKQRAIYRSAHAYKSRNYRALCIKADKLNKQDRPGPAHTCEENVR
jgi:hypothetical protein